MQPFNYSIQAENPADSILQGIQAGVGIRGLRDQRQQQQQQAQANQQIAQLIAKAQAPGATAQDYKALALMLPPEQAKSVRETYAMANDEQKNAALTRTGQLISALQSGNKAAYEQLFDTQIAARKSAGEEEAAKFLVAMKDVAGEDPQAVIDAFSTQMAMMPGGEKILDGILKQRKAPGEIQETQANIDLKKAETQLKNAETALKYAEATAKRAEASGGKSEESQLKLEKARLDLQEARTAAAEKKLQKDYEGKDALLKLDTAIGTVNRILTHPQLDDVVGMADQWVALGESEKKVASDIDTLKSQAFLAQLPGMKGFGALSEGDRLALTTAIGNINRGVSEKDFRAELGNIKAIFEKMKSATGERYGINQGAETVTVGGKTYTKPANFTDAQWAEYKNAVGAK